MIYIGIDPSFSGTGYVVLTAEGECLGAATIKEASKEGSHLDRALNIRDALFEQLIPNAPLGAHVAIENYSLNSKFGLAMLVTLGTVLRLAIREQGWTYVEPTPQAVKAFALMGKKITKKQKPIAECERLWGFKHKSKDVIDAYVLAQIARGSKGLGTLAMKQVDVLAGLRHA